MHNYFWHLGKIYLVVSILKHLQKVESTFSGGGVYFGFHFLEIKQIKASIFRNKKNWAFEELKKENWAFQYP